MYLLSSFLFTNLFTSSSVKSVILDIDDGEYQYLEENPGIKNGSYKRNLKTKYGELKQLSAPRNRDNTFHSAVIESNKTVGLEELITSLYSNGVSTRRISAISKDVLNNRYSPSSISRITDLTLEEVNKFVNRKLDKRYIAVMLDGLFFYLRRGTVDKEPVIFALGIKESGEYERHIIEASKL